MSEIKGKFKTFVLDIHDSSTQKELEKLLNDGWRAAGPSAMSTVEDSVFIILFKTPEPDKKKEDKRVDMFREGVGEGLRTFASRPWYVRLFPKLVKNK